MKRKRYLREPELDKAVLKELVKGKWQRPRISALVPDPVSQRWSMDFVSNQRAIGQRLRILDVVDDFSRECVIRAVDSSIFW